MDGLGLGLVTRTAAAPPYRNARPQNFVWADGEIAWFIINKMLVSVSVIVIVLYATPEQRAER
jgi:hypothetical protein